MEEAANDDDSENFEDMKFNGGLLVPGKIWHRLYKYVLSNVWLTLFIIYIGLVTIDTRGREYSGYGNYMGNKLAV